MKNATVGIPSIDIDVQAETYFNWVISLAKWFYGSLISRELARFLESLLENDLMSLVTQLLVFHR